MTKYSIGVLFCFVLFFCSVSIIFRERRERESFYSSVERESIDVDSDKKKRVDLGVNKFYLMKKISPKCYFFFLLSEKLDMLARIFLGSG
jgi:hypothetical protein